MHCKYCDIDIETETKICPICHEKLEDIDDTLPKAYPDKIKRKRKHKHFTLPNIYMLVGLVLFLISVTVNYLTDTSILWCYIVGALVLYGFVLIKNTIMSRYSIGAKIFVQTLCITLFIFLVQFLIGKGDMWAFDYAMPIIHIISVVVMAILVACFFFNDRNNLVSMIIFSILGVVPIILYFTNVLSVLWPSLLDAILSAVVILTIVIFGHKELHNEFRRKFHI